MIIISQDKTEIINFNNIESIWICSDEEGIFTIEATADTNATLGYYDTEERAKDWQHYFNNFMFCSSYNKRLVVMYTNSSFVSF